jgi:hypothetical protein
MGYEKIAKKKRLGILIPRGSWTFFLIRGNHFTSFHLSLRAPLLSSSAPYFYTALFFIKGQNIIAKNKRKRSLFSFLYL